MSFAIRKDYRTITNLTRLIHKFSNLTQFFCFTARCCCCCYLINRGLNGWVSMSRHNIWRTTGTREPAKSGMTSLEVVHFNWHVETRLILLTDLFLTLFLETCDSFEYLYVTLCFILEHLIANCGVFLSTLRIRFRNLNTSSHLPCKQLVCAALSQEKATASRISFILYLSGSRLNDVNANDLREWRTSEF